MTRFYERSDSEWPAERKRREKKCNSFPERNWVGKKLGRAGLCPALTEFFSGQSARYRNLLERLDRRCLIFLHIKDGIQLGDLQQVMHFLGEVEQLQFAALILRSSKSADQLADAGAVNVVDLAEVQDNLLVAFGEEVAHGVAHHYTAFAESDT